MTPPSEIDIQIAALLAGKNEQAILELLRRGKLKPDQVFTIAGVSDFVELFARWTPGR